MNPDEMETPLGRERLHACACKVPVNGKMISMCDMNATDLRRSLNQGMRPGRGFHNKRPGKTGAPSYLISLAHED